MNRLLQCSSCVTRGCAWFAVAAFIVLLAAPCSFATDQEPPRPTQWNEDDVERFARIPIQHDGRIKPMLTFARFTLLTMSGRSSVRYDVDGETIKRGPVEWLMDTLFTEDVAKTQPIFLVEDWQVLEAIGIKGKIEKKRDRYSWLDLRPARSELMRQGQALSKAERDGKKLSRIPRQVLNLAESVNKFERLLDAMAFATASIDVRNLAKHFDAFKEKTSIDAMAFLPHVAKLASVVAKADPKALEAIARGTSLPDGLSAEATAAAEALRSYDRALLGADMLAVVPPPTNPEVHDEWLTLDEGAQYAVSTFLSSADAATQAISKTDAVDLVRAWSAMGQAAGTPETIGSHIEKAHTLASRLAGARGEIDNVELEARYYRLDPLFKSHMLYIVAFVLFALTWFAPRSKWLFRIAVACVSAALILHIFGIVIRSIIRGRPPVSTLYETVLFVSAGAALTLLVIEFLNRKRIAVVLASLLGAAGLWLASGYEELVKTDTMPQLVAVLNTNFWLAVHVTTVTFGYAAGLMAACVAHVHVLGRIFGFKKHDPGFYRDLNRMTYGLICFGLLFSIFGTMTGGIWANDSWGRFWGWDPKENGALMICLVELAILHGRMGGYIKQFGIAMSSIVLGVIVAFSWWHVNQLDYGLHSYGRTEGIMSALKIFYIVETAILSGGVVWWLQQRGAKALEA